MSFSVLQYLPRRLLVKVNSTLSVSFWILANISDFVNLSTDAIAVAGLTMQKSFAEKWEELDAGGAKISVLPSVEDAFDYTRKLSADARKGDEEQQVHAFITGSVHLVGRALGILEDVDAL